MRPPIFQLSKTALCLSAIAFSGTVVTGKVSAHADTTATDAKPPLVRRLTEAQYRQSIDDIFGDIKIVGRFEPDMRVDGLLAEGTGRVSITPGGLEQYETIARSIAAQVVDDAHWNRNVDCMPNSDDSTGARCAAAFFARVGTKLYRRPLRSEEIRHAVEDTLASARALGSFSAGIAAALSGMLASPDFLFRIDQVQRQQLDGYSKAVRLSYFLWNTTPDEDLFAAAARGDLDDARGLAQQIERMLASPRFENGTRAFFNDFLRLDDIDTLSKDATIYPGFSARVAADAREQTLRTITDLLLAQRGSYRDLFTTRRFAMNRVLGPLYRVPVANRGWTFYEFPRDDERAGLLTQLSFLAQYSHPGRTSPTLRGKAVREVLMCEEVPTPPANVNFSVVQDVTNPNLRTTRERVQAHLNDEECASCHKKTDPIGLGLEHFDGVGQFRLTENGSAINASGALDSAAFANATQLGENMRQSPAVASCLVQSVYRYATSASIAKGKNASLERFENTFVAGDYRFIELIRTIANSPEFYAVDSASTATAFQLPSHVDRRDKSR